MKKTTWLLLAISVVAILLVAGCQPTTPATTPTPTPTATATTPPTDKECPKPVSTVIGSAYSNDGYRTKLTITFDEPITSGCIEDPKNWDIVVKNSDRKDTSLTEDEGKVTVLVATLSTDGKKAYVYATVEETLSYVVKDVVYSYKVGTTVYNNGFAEGPFAVTDTFKGLICSEDDADDYATPDTDKSSKLFAGVKSAASLPSGGELVGILDYDLVSGPDTPEYADVVEWKLKDCVIADELGNACCDYSGSACCLEPTCATCEEGCPLGSEGSCL